MSDETSVQEVLDEIQQFREAVRDEFRVLRELILTGFASISHEDLAMISFVPSAHNKK